MSQQQFYGPVSQQQFYGTVSQQQFYGPAELEPEPLPYDEYEGEDELPPSVTAPPDYPETGGEEYPGEGVPLEIFGYPTPGQKLEKVLVIVKPEAYDRVYEIMNILEREGLYILQQRRCQLSAEQASEFYQDNYEVGIDVFTEYVTNLSSGPIMALVVSGPSAIKHIDLLFGPTSYADRVNFPKCLRNIYGVPEKDVENGLYCSADESEALREIHFFFPEEIVEPIISGNMAEFYLNENVHPVLTIGLAQMIRERPDDPIMWLGEWLLSNNPNKPKAFAANIC